MPDGVFNVVHGDKVAVDALLAHPDVAALSFVGSTPIAEYIYTEGTKRGKRVQALGGAKNHLVVMPDADLDQAVDALIGAAYGSAGERCMAISVAVAVGHVADELIERLTPRVKSLEDQNGMESRRGDGTAGDGGASRQGGRLYRRGRRGGREARRRRPRPSGRAATRRASFSAARCSTMSRTDMKIYQEEIFGPVLCVVRVPDFASAVELINAHEFA